MTVRQHEPAPVGREPRRGGPVGTARPGAPERLVERQRTPVGSLHAPLADRAHVEVRVHPHPCPPRRGQCPLADLRRPAGERAGAAHHPVAVRSIQRQRPTHRHDQLEPAGARAHHADRQRSGRVRPSGARPAEQLQPALVERRHRLDRGGVLARARHRQIRRRAGVEREQVPADRWSPRGVVEPDLPSFEIERRHLGAHEAHAGPGAQAQQVDVHLLDRVVPGDQSRQHARIGREHVSRDERQAHAGERPHRPAADEQRVTVTAADEHHVAHERCPPAGHGVHALARCRARIASAVPLNRTRSRLAESW